MFETNRVLPGEILDNIFKLLPPKDLMSVVEVCRMWRAIGENPAFWGWVEISVTRANISYMPEMLALRRLQYARSLTLTSLAEESDNPTYNVMLFKAIETHTKLKKLDMSILDVSSVEPALLTSAVAKMEKVKMAECYLTTEQVQALFNKLIEDTNITSLDMSHNNLSSIDPTLFVTALNKLTQVYIDTTEVTSQQMEALFNCMNVNTNIKSLSIANSTLSLIEPTLLVTVIEKLLDLDISYTTLTAHQIIMLNSVQDTRFKNTLIQMEDFNLEQDLRSDDDDD